MKFLIGMVVFSFWPCFISGQAETFKDTIVRDTNPSILAKGDSEGQLFLWGNRTTWQVSQVADTARIRRKMDFFEKRDISLNLYDFSSEDINLHLTHALDHRTRRNVKYGRAIVSGTLAATCFILIPPAASENEIHSAGPFINVFLIPFGAVFTVDSVIFFVKGGQSNKRMKQKLDLARAGIL